MDGAGTATKQAIVLLSGGIDSSVCLYLTKQRYETRALTFEYSGIAQREIEAARAIAGSAGVLEHRFVRLPDLREASEIGGASFDGLPPTYIAMRNSIFYSFAASYAEEVRADVIAGGHIKDDAKTFYDVRPRFFKSLERSFWAGSPILGKKKTRIVRPLKAMTKSQVLRLGSDLGVPLGLTWSCHREGENHCWECEGCLARKAAFKGTGIPDPLKKPRLTGKIS